jgi:hypothetical protein
MPQKPTGMSSPATESRSDLALTPLLLQSWRLPLLTFFFGASSAFGCPKSARPLELTEQLVLVWLLDGEVARIQPTLGKPNRAAKQAQPTQVSGVESADAD